ncbi:exoribonuclease [Arthrobacter crystallopoietes BAB-32]|uniref:Exoribonuclease n=1 Tax=Arthrobacter crystallopoietes BAB-32 TaxID=1246476 RepID=N1V4B3_9MICC|nr:RNB domain-containing ribonuclease [Arthrobacter crystallopoietes]EMY33093.1 exoribonuclease [Arthrobacter crystallopoietes BAB-32]
MPYPHVDAKVNESQHLLARVLKELRTELELPGHFTPSVLAEAEKAIAQQRLPERDLTGLDFITIDPPGSTDLDQAMYLERDGSGYKVWYAIADVPSFIEPGGELDEATRRRGQTIYAPDGRIPLHPEAISEDAGSLLPDRDRSAFVWEFALDGGANVAQVALFRAVVRSRAQLTYEEVQQDIDSGTAPEYLELLKEIGCKRQALELQRGGASLKLPEEEIAHDGRHYFIVARPALPVEDWNAQISLMTGMAAARIMLDGNIGILRTMPAPDAESEAKFRRQTKALGHPWPQDIAYGEYLRGLDTAEPKQLALMNAAASLFRGAGYTPFDGGPPEEQLQAAIAAPYAHTTAPLRRLVDRFVLLICEALVAGNEVPDWVREALPVLPELMAASDQLASRLERASLDAVEAALLSHRVGEEFDAVVISARQNNHGNGTNSNGNGRREAVPHGTIQLSAPAVTARCDGELEPGTSIRARLVEADIAKRSVRFELVTVHS